MAREINRLTEPEVGKQLTAIGDRLSIILNESARSGLSPLDVVRRQVLSVLVEPCGEVNATGLLLTDS